MASKTSEYIFVTKPDDNLLCSICLDLPTQPKQCEDCGKLFCSECIEKHGNKPCPNCRIEKPQFFKDAKSKREIQELKVRCDNKDSGCQWTGTIGTLDNHMSTCQFALVSCPNKCEEDEQLTILRKDMDNHLETTCPNRAHQCQHCGEKGTYSSITEDHDKVCNKKTVPCPNKERGCPLSMEQGKTKQHVRSVCDYTEVACTYESLGCGMRMLRKDIEEHEKNAREQHLTYSLASVRTLMLEQHKTLSEGEAFVFKITDYDKMKKKHEPFFSNAFFTYLDGYKMCIEGDFNGAGSAAAGTHMSVFTNILDGPHDDQLHWPFIGTVKYELLNQLADDNHHKRKSSFDDDSDMQVGSSRGKAKFLPHSSLSHDPATNTQYLLDDTLYFRVSVTVDNHKPWLVCTNKVNRDITRAIKDNKTLKDGEPLVFKMTGYKGMKSTGGWFYNDPFNIGGYNMYIAVNPNGNGDNHGTHVSVHVKLLEGVNDASLPWPFMGTVTITLLNQLTNDNHCSRTVNFTIETGAVVGTKRGKPRFIRHSALAYDPVKNTQYLKDDTLYFRVTVSVDNHKSWLVCTHHK